MGLAVLVVGPPPRFTVGGFTLPVLGTISPVGGTGRVRVETSVRQSSTDVTNTDVVSLSQSGRGPGGRLPTDN